jgi:hypothetical protein
MSSTSPNHITPPSVEAYPYIRLLYENLDCHHPDEHKDSERVGPHVVADIDFDDSNQNGPHKIDTTIMAPLAAMTGETFEALCSVLKPKFQNEIITSRDNLADMARREYGNITEASHPASTDQVMSYLLLSARVNRYVEWARLADLYNASTDDQQEALYQYFSIVKNRDLAILLATQAPAIDLPPAFDKPLQTRIENGEKQAFDVAKDRWLREDFVINQFEVYGVDSYHRDLLISTAPTLELAIARAIQGAINFKGTLAHISLAQLGQFVATGEVKFTSGNHPHVKDKDPRITWRHADLRPKNDQGGITKTEFLKTLYATEEALGMQWSKVSRLEDELGL